MVADTKRHIDNARQILVGVVPNPISQIDQITYALIYKFMDDMDQSALKEGGEASFFTGDLERYSWSQLLSPRIGNQERLYLYVEAFNRFAHASQIPELFRDILKNANLPYRSPEVLGLFLKEIEYFDYSHPEELGNAYEYLLSIMGSQGDAGQFRTPRHLIDFIVDIVQPTEKDRILDPACGTGGFLVKAYQHILAQHSGEKRLTPSQKQELMDQIEGYDIDPGMVRIAQVNMFLHQFKNPKIYQYDTLSMEERWREKYDVIMANPPFMSPKGGIKPHNKFSVKSTRSEVLFVDYIMNHLKPKGRAGIIVPEGIIFQSGTAYKQLRKNLLQDGLYGVVSLPSGIFQPYSGVKTSVLLFDNELAKMTDSILFANIKDIGVSLGASQRKIEKNDLPKALEIIRQWQKGEKVDHPLALYVEKSQIAENGNYNLSGERYRVSTNLQSKYDLVKLGELIVEQSERVKDKKNIEVWSVSNKEGFILSTDYFSNQVASTDISNYKIIKPGFFAYNPSRVNVGSIALNSSLSIGAVSPMYTVFSIKDSTILSQDYLFRLLKSEKANEFIVQLAQGAVRQQLKINDLKVFQIPLPPLEIQEQIVAELDGYQNIIAGAKQIIANWKPTIDIEPTWPKVKLGEVLKRVSNQIDPQKETGEIVYIGLEDIESGTGSVIDFHPTQYSKIKSLKNVFSKGNILYGKLRPNLNKVWLSDRSGICSTDILVFEATEKSKASFYAFLMLSNGFVEEVMQGIIGAQLPRVGYDFLHEILLPLPPIETQQQIVEKIESERTLVESAKKLIQIYEQKTKVTIARLWEATK